ncbi:MAG TPA: hypothetical protein VIM84_11340, partial [Gemmatimonadales bacterium]
MQQGTENTMNTTIDTSNYRLDRQGDTAAVLIREAGEWMSFTGQLPLAKAVDCIRRLLNGSHFSDVGWTMLDEDANPAIAAALGLTPEPSAPHGCDEDEERAAYRRYISDGLADTDGWYIPMSFEAWREHHHRTIGHLDPRTADCTPTDCHAPRHERVHHRTVYPGLKAGQRPRRGAPR